MSLISIKLIYTIIDLSNVIYRCSIDIFIYLDNNLNGYALAFLNFRLPSNHATRLCSAVICGYKLRMLRQFICDFCCDIFVFGVLVGNRIGQFLSRLYHLTVNLSRGCSFKYFFLWRNMFVCDDIAVLCISGLYAVVESNVNFCYIILDFASIFIVFRKICECSCPVLCLL